MSNLVNVVEVAEVVVANEVAEGTAKLKRERTMWLNTRTNRMYTAKTYANLDSRYKRNNRHDFTKVKAREVECSQSSSSIYGWTDFWLLDCGTVVATWFENTLENDCFKIKTDVRFD